MSTAQLTPKQDWLNKNLKAGEAYAGILLGKNGEPDHHLILLPGADDKRMPWKDAVALAKKSGGELPTRREQSLLFANLKDEFKSEWYWSGEQHAAGSGCAWGQYFYHGTQVIIIKSSQGRARAVRRLVIL